MYKWERDNGTLLHVGIQSSVLSKYMKSIYNTNDENSNISTNFQRQSYFFVKKN